MQSFSNVEKKKNSYYNKIYKSPTGPIRELIHTLIVGTVSSIISGISLSIALFTMSIWGSHKVTKFKIWRIRKLTSFKIWVYHNFKGFSRYIELDDYFRYIEKKFVR